MTEQDIKDFLLAWAFEDYDSALSMVRTLLARMPADRLRDLYNELHTEGETDEVLATDNHNLPDHWSVPGA